mgnify:CR=1 FL=1
MIFVQFMHELIGRHVDEVAAFLTVVETRSFARAAKILGRDPTVLSRRVSALETRLGVRLIERTTRVSTPTEAGERFADRARAALAGLHEAEKEASEASRAVTGTLRLALPGAFGRSWIAPRLPEFLRSHPAVRLEASFSDRYVNLVAENFDLALRIGSLADSSLISRRVAYSRRLLCAAPAYLASRPPILAPNDLAAHDLLQFTGLATHPEWRLQRRVGGRSESFRLRATGRVATDEIDLLVHAALDGAGILLCSEWLVAGHVASGALTPVLDAWSCGEGEAITLLRPAGRHTRLSTRVFADWLAARLDPAPWVAAAGKRDAI